MGGKRHGGAKGMGGKRPNMSRWNIGCIGSPCIGACIGHVHFMLFMLISFVLGGHANPVSSGIWAYVSIMYV